MTIYAALVLALLGSYRHLQYRPCIRARATEIAQALEEAEREHGVPPSLMLAVGLLETHCGCAWGENGGWGAPVSPRRRHTAGTHLHAARALRRSREVCGSWEGAVSRFRWGLCRPPAGRRGYRPAAVLELARRLEERARGLVGSEAGCGG